MKNSIKYENRKARYEYFILDKWQAGIALSGTEVKSIKNSSVDFNGSWCEIRNGEVWLRELSIPEVKTAFSHKSKEQRKLLLNKKEIKKIENSLDNGISLIPISIYTNENGLIKVEIALCKGKKAWDKRETIKKRDLSREFI